MEEHEALWWRTKIRHRPTRTMSRVLLNAGTSLVFHVGHGEDNGWVHSINVGTLSRLQNEDRLPVVLSAGCSTARFATLPPYEAYEDVHGAKHTGTNAGEVFSSPPPPPSPYARGKFNYTGLGELMVRRGMSGAVAYIGCNTGGQPCGLTLLEGFVRTLHEPARAHARRLLGRRHQLLLRDRAPGHNRAKPGLVSPEHFLSRDEVHGLRRPGACAAGPP